MIFVSKKQTGFSLVETLVAISILLIVITGPMTISMRSAKSSSFATEQVEAFFLAQEGVELVEKLRDDYLLDYFKGDILNPWGRFTTTSNCFNAAGCGLEWDSNSTAVKAPVLCGGTNCKIWRVDADTRSHFTHVSGSNIPTPFTRTIYLTSSGDEVYVRSVVTWRTGSLVEGQTVEVDTYLYNIYDTP